MPLQLLFQTSPYSIEMLYYSTITKALMLSQETIQTPNMVSKPYLVFGSCDASSGLARISCYHSAIQNRHDP
jgi:hypothetical protein